MHYTTKEDKILVQNTIHRFVQTGDKLSVKRYQRLIMWLEGNTFAAIAKVEGVSQQAIANSVRRDFARVKRFAKSQHNH